MTDTRQAEIANRARYILSLCARLQESEADAVWVNEDGTPSARAQTVAHYNVELYRLRVECRVNGWADPAPRAWCWVAVSGAKERPHAAFRYY